MKNGNTKSVEELTQSLENAIRGMTGRQTQSPKIVILPKKIPAIGKLAHDVIEAHSKQEELKEELEGSARTRQIDEEISGANYLQSPIHRLHLGYGSI